jgi:hypothetical protein
MPPPLVEPPWCLAPVSPLPAPRRKLALMSRLKWPPCATSGAISSPKTKSKKGGADPAGMEVWRRSKWTAVCSGFCPRNAASAIAIEWGWLWFGGGFLGIEVLIGVDREVFRLCGRSSSPSFDECSLALDFFLGELSRLLGYRRWWRLGTWGMGSCWEGVVLMIRLQWGKLCSCIRLGTSVCGEVLASDQDGCGGKGLHKLQVINYCIATDRCKSIKDFA